MMIKESAIILMCLSLSFGAVGQSTSFESTLNSQKPLGITLSLGKSGFINGNTGWHSSQFLSNPSTGELDTLHYGSWGAKSPYEWMGGVGINYIFKDPILVDRFGFNVYCGNRNIQETYNGVYENEDTVMVSTASALNIGASLTAYHSFTISPDLFIEAGLGGTIRRDFFPEVNTFVFDHHPDAVPGELPLFTGSIEAKVGVGFMMWKGRFLRIHAATDLLQLNPINGTGKTPWLMTDFRPFSVIVNWDLHPKVRGPRNCAGPTDVEGTKELFGSDMKGWRRASNKFTKKKKKKKRRR
ncbi:MAG: hypothetical protein CL823_03945 [Crocinitomicaceae bacterium]|nr:hypothetical protein [Crocinitomicaceae bacterium]|tara:strand:- start:1487 stop:2380 length:894 start_codon:yes stop_codon:yes gene_type:complete